MGLVKRSQHCQSNDTEVFGADHSNGLGAGDRIAQHMKTDNVLLGVAEGFGASIKAPGHIHHNAMRLIRIGELNGGRQLAWNGLK